MRQLFVKLLIIIFYSKVEFVRNDVFCSGLMSWNTAIPQATTDRILMRLDEYNSGGVTPHNLTRVLGKMSLTEFVESYSRGTVYSIFYNSFIFEVAHVGNEQGRDQQHWMSL